MIGIEKTFWRNTSFPQRGEPNKCSADSASSRWGEHFSNARTRRVRATIVRAFLFLFLVLPAAAQERIVTSINSDWLFRKADGPDYAHTTATSGWEKVSIPHTWNATDVTDDEPGYYRGIGWYKKTLHIPASKAAASTSPSKARVRRPTCT
jgi:hypothetical protein